MKVTCRNFPPTSPETRIRDLKSGQCFWWKDELFIRIGSLLAHPTLNGRKTWCVNIETGDTYSGDFGEIFVVPAKNVECLYDV